MRTLQVGKVPEQAPLQPANADAELGLAVRVTLLLNEYASEQSDPQLIPGGELVIVPVPVPLLVTVKGWGGGGLNVAITLEA
jgi:hypothetical protein